MNDYRWLAAAVLIRAMEDAVSHTVERHPGSMASWEDTEDARRFLTEPSEDLEFWCALAGVTMDGVIRYGRALARGGWSGR